MATNNDSQTKVLSVRIPMEKYLELLKETMELKISMSDYLLMKLYNQPPISEEYLDKIIKDSQERINKEKQLNLNNDLEIL